MKRNLAFVLVALILVLGCGAQAGEKIKLRFAWWGGAERHEATLAVIKAFEAKNPDVEIVGEYTGWEGYLERLTTQLGAGSEPDIPQIDLSWLVMFSKDGNGFYDLFKLKDYINLDDFPSRWLKSSTIDGKLNAIPTSWTGVLCMWNKTVWDQAGIEFPKTWDDFIQNGIDFHKKLGPDYFPMDVNWHEVILLTHAYIFQKTGRQFINPTTNEIDLSIEEITDWMSMYKRLLDSGTLMPMNRRASLSGGQTTRQSQEFAEFIDGKWAGTLVYDAAMSVRLSSARPEFKWVAGDYPTLKDAKCSGRIARSATLFAVSKNSKHPEMAAKFINFMLDTEEGAMILKSTRGPMLSNTSLKVLKDNNLIPELNIEAMKQTWDGETYLPSPYYEHVRIKNVMQQAVEGIGFGRMTPEDAAKLLYNDCKRVLQRLNRR